MPYSLRLGQGQHVMLMGMTGTGKTTLARRLLASRRFAVVIDSKHELDWQGFTITRSVDAALSETHAIYRPPLPPFDAIAIDDLLRQVYQMGGWNLYVDEIYTLGRGNALTYPASYITLLTRGRSKGITVWTGTQRPAFFPRFAYTEARHVFMFRLGSADDQRTIARALGAPMLADIRLRGHDFTYYNREQHRAIVTRLGKDDLA